jgi:multiple sugar transport system permease protein
MTGGASRFPGLITVWISYERRPVPTADNQRLGIPDLRNMFAEYTADYGGVMAAAVLSILPILLVFIFLQRYFVEGITMSGIKG